MTGSIHLVKGADDILRAEQLSRLVDELVAGGDRSLLVDEFAGADYELAAAIDAAQTLPFLTDRRIVVARHLSRFGNAEAQAPLLAYLAAPVDSTDLVLVWEKSPEAGTKLNPISPKLRKALDTAGVVEHDSQPPARQREGWVGEQFEAHGLFALDGRAANSSPNNWARTPVAVVELIERVAGIFGPSAHLGVDEFNRCWVKPVESRPGADRRDRPGRSRLALERLGRMIARRRGRHPLRGHGPACTATTPACCGSTVLRSAARRMPPSCWE